MYFDGAANHYGYGISVFYIPHDDHIPRFVRLAFSDRHLATNNIVKYEACILGLETTLELGIRQMETKLDDGLLWYHDIYHFLRLDAYLEPATTRDKRALRQRSADGMLLLCLDHDSTDRVIREVHAGVCGPHMEGHILARKIMRIEMSKVSDTWGPHSRATLRVTCIDFTMAIFNMGDGFIEVALEQQILEADWAQARLD
ncbi:hypothetical protein AAG906_021476 [Vitis piasezkii]